jgi:hypothetical protein
MRLATHASLAVATGALALDALPRVLLATGSSVEGIAGCALVAAAGVMLFETLWETALQDHIPPELLARVSSYDWLGSLVPIPIGYLVVGPLAALIGPATTLWIAGAAQLLVVVGALATGNLRTLGSRPDRRGAAGRAWGSGGSSMVPAPYLLSNLAPEISQHAVRLGGPLVFRRSGERGLGLAPLRAGG